MLLVLAGTAPPERSGVAAWRLTDTCVDKRLKSMYGNHLLQLCAWLQTSRMQMVLQQTALGSGHKPVGLPDGFHSYS